MPVQTQEYGHVVEVRYPLVTATGLPHVGIDEVVKFADGGYGKVFGLRQQEFDVLVFSQQVPAVGTGIERTQQVLTTSFSNTIFGTVLSPLTDIGAAQGLPIDTQPRVLTDRRLITESMKTGVAIVDLVLALGKGQRELVLGDRNTGKTSFAIQAACHQARQGAAVVYAMIGKTTAEIKQVYDTFNSFGVLDSVVIVASTADDPPPLIIQTPFTAMTVAEHCISQGREALVIFDDLSNHAVFYRQVALLAKQFPGRDSYPGDMFYTHARLLERAGSFVHPQQADQTISITCLPIVETTDSELTDFVVSNLVSITDGHIMFDSGLFAAGNRPAVDAAGSVTRVGRQTQNPLELDIAKELVRSLTRYKRAVNLAHFGAELTQETQQRIAIGSALYAFFGQHIDTMISPAVMLCMSAAILSGQLIELSADKIQQRRAALQAAYSGTSAVQKQLDQLVAEAQSAQQLSRLLHKKSDWIEKIWQP